MAMAFSYERMIDVKSLKFAQVGRLAAGVKLLEYKLNDILKSNSFTPQVQM